MANIYEINSRSGNASFLEFIESRLLYWLKKIPNSLLVIGGDFNIATDSALDKWPPGRPSSLNLKFKKLMERLDVIDVWWSKFPNTKAFTWSNKAASGSTTFSNLD